MLYVFYHNLNTLEKGKATHSSMLAWRNPWTKEPSGLQSMGSQKLDTTEQLSLSFFFQNNNKIPLPRVVLYLNWSILLNMLNSLVVSKNV